MTDRVTFLAAIRDEPDQDVHRLVYADWLEDNGDPSRAEFIRVQVELARGTASRERQRELLGRERVLRREHQASWLLPLRGAWRAAIVEFDRGMATFCPANHRFLEPRFREQATEAFRQAGVIGLIGWPERFVKRWATSPVLAEFASLDVPDDPFWKVMADSIAASPSLAGLRSLELSYQWTEEGSLQALASSPRLRGLTHLDAGGMWGDFDQDGLQAITSPDAFPRLTSLTLRGRAHSAPRLSWLLGAAYFPRLTALDLEYWGLGHAGLPALVRAVPKGLRRLGLSSTRMRNVEARALAEADLPHLTALDVSDNAIGSGGAVALVESPRLPRLRELNLRRVRLGASGARTLARSPGLGRLTCLDLVGTGMGVAGMRALADSPHLGNLTHLSIGDQGSEDAAIKQLARSPFVAGLVRMELWKLTARSARALAQSPYLDDLAILDLRTCNISEQAARELARGRSLGQLQRLLLWPPRFQGEHWLRARFGDAVQRVQW
jgi:uncharacterized protein (TIGR02996 family)